MIHEGDITYGGFIPSNIRRGLIDELIESGDPDNYFMALSDELEKIRDEVNEKYNGNVNAFIDAVTGA